MTRFAEAADGTRIAFDRHQAETDSGTLPPILLVHGFASDAAVTWEGTGWVRALQRAGRDVITLDLRGHGRSDKPVDAENYAPALVAADLGVVLDAAGVETVDVVGYSRGARVASVFAQSAPRRIRRLVLGGAGPLDAFSAWRSGDVERMLHSADYAGDELARAVVGPALAAGADPAVLLACIVGMSGVRLQPPSGIPVLFVAGGLDPVVEGAAELAAEWGAEFVSVPGRDHINVLTARAFKDAVLAFLS